ncbi:hypothetical protein HY734_01665 [Candidatus Uhrbacteria bacterium]|nr:hypothetical protein [Candidatus Uhrbacteria bacterium]
MFIDDRVNEIRRQWEDSGCEREHELLPLVRFESIEQSQTMLTLQPDVILVGYGLSKSGITGTNVIRALRKEGYAGLVIANSGGGRWQFEDDGIKIDESANRNPEDLKSILNNLEGRRR